jgi:GNAT superfamily N-acetyltransferase
MKVYCRDEFIGFYALKEQAGRTIELDHLWLSPGNLRKGYGRRIFKHIIGYLRQEGHSQVLLVAEPYAAGFYEKMGGKVKSKFQSPASGRMLDVYIFTF